MITFPSKYLPETHAYIANCTTKPDAVWTVALNTLIQTLIIDGIWPLLDTFWIFATPSQQAARINVVKPFGTQITEVSSPTWTALQGYHSNGTTSYLNTNYNPVTTANNYTQNNASFGFYDRTIVTTGNPIAMGTPAGDNYTRYLQVHANSTNANYTINENNTIFGNFANPGFPVGLYSAARTTSSSMQMYHNGSLLNTNSATSISVTSVNFVLLQGNGANFDQSQMAMAFAGSGSINQLNLYNAFQAFMTTL